MQCYSEERTITKSGFRHLQVLQLFRKPVLNTFCIASFFLGIQALSLAATYTDNQIYDGSSLKLKSLEEALSQVSPGSIVIISELHDNPSHHRHQMEALQHLEKGFHKGLSLGMEFFDYTKQDIVNDFLSGKIQDSEFLPYVEWGKTPWSYYRPLVLFPSGAGGTTWALNSPKRITSKVKRTGVESLTADEIKLLPPNWSLGNRDYLERFREIIGGGHSVPEESIARYFEAQSIWDETMAWRAVSYMEKFPQQILVILVGDFHAAYGGGLPDKIRNRGWTKTLVISQVAISEMEESEIQQTMRPHARYGPRAELIWIGNN
jgi:uncharacterized iron-regulated protein